MLPWRYIGFSFATVRKIINEFIACRKTYSCFDEALPEPASPFARHRRNTEVQGISSLEPVVHSKAYFSGGQSQYPQ